jgi:NAD-dependent dihydropyrimidine dehydrogenase PreA subunit
MVNENYVIPINWGTVRDFIKVLEGIPEECKDYNFSCCGMPDCYLHIRPNDFNGNKFVTLDTEECID